jgi:hypothetical protein
MRKTIDLAFIGSLLEEKARLLQSTLSSKSLPRRYRLFLVGGVFDPLR